MYQDSLLLVSLDLKKSYKNLDRGRLIKTLKVYRLGPKLQELLE